jgi:hypothetical protein
MAGVERFGAQPQTRLSRLSVFTLPPRPTSLAAIKGWFDDSRRENVCAVGGYAGADHRWEYFENNWPIMLAKHDVPYLHMKEAGNPTGVYAKWLPAQEHQEEWSAFLGDLADVISESRLVFFGSIVRVSHLEKFNREFRLALEAYPLAVYGCMMMVATEHSETSELFFDHLEKAYSKIARAREYAESDRYAGQFERMATAPLPKTITFRELYALQAADFMTWEFRKHHEKVADWFDLADRPSGHDERWEHMQRWSIEKFQSPIPTPRKSVAALVEGNQIAPFIWDYDHLCEAQRLRGGKWA